MLNFKELTAIRNENESREPSSERDTIAALLKHIQAVHDQTHLRYRVAYEVFWLGKGVTYGKRDIKAICWTRAHAEAINRASKHYLHVSVIHVIKIDGKWHRISVLPFNEEIVGNLECARLSPLDPAPQGEPT